MTIYTSDETRPYPAAVACLANDFASLSVHLRFPRQHWTRIRHSNLIERTFGVSTASEN
ncbi:hypothetical protein [Mycobacterium sp.]|uniref:hypothetical protein n=1 Tax=Mycobacterium sp. TaxID=1785 RepID=UPI003BAC0F87